MASSKPPIWRLAFPDFNPSSHINFGIQAKPPLTVASLSAIIDARNKGKAPFLIFSRRDLPI
jgi:hypothetical protein